MLGAFRNKMRVWSQIALWPVIAAFIGTIFLVWGRGGASGTAGPDAVLVVNGQAAGPEQYAETERILRQTYQNMYRERFEEMTREIDWQKLALETLTDDLLIQQAAEQLGVQVTDGEVRQRILTNSYFQRDGRFDEAVFRRVLQMSRMTESQFVQGMRDDLLTTKVRNLVMASALVTRDEAWDDFRLRNEKVNASAYILRWSEFTGSVDAADAEIQAYYDAHTDDYKVGDEVMLNYVLVPFARFRDQVTVEDEEVQGYYTDHLDEFKEEEQVRARHILIKAPEGAPAEQEQAARQRAQALLDRIRAGEDFATLATENSEDTGSGARGGDLGFFGRGRMVPPFEKAAFEAQVGSVTDLVRSTFGFHIIKVEEKKEARTKPEAEAAVEIRQNLIEERAKTLALDTATGISNAAFDSGSLQAALAELKIEGYEVKSTDWFERAGSPRELGPMPELADALKQGLAKGEAGPAAVRRADAVVLELADERPAHLRLLTEVRDQVIEKVKLDKARALAVARAEDLQRQLAAGTAWEKLGDAFEKEPTETGLFARGSGYVPRVGRSEEGVARLFAAAVGEAILIPEAGTATALVRVTEHQAAAEAEFDQKLAEERARLLKQKQNQVLTAWLEAQRKAAKIELGRTVKDVRLFEEK